LQHQEQLQQQGVETPTATMPAAMAIIPDSAPNDALNCDSVAKISRTATEGTRIGRGGSRPKFLSHANNYLRTGQSH
jgi:hypothetical protein